jgi:hypothetical protein
MIDLTKDPSAPANVQFNVCKDLLDRLAQASGHQNEAKKDSEEIISFEQILRVSNKRSAAGEDLDDESDMAAIKELKADGVEVADPPQIPDFNKVH